MRLGLVATLMGLLAACSSPADAQKATVAEARRFAAAIVPEIQASLEQGTLAIDAEDPLVLHLAGHPDWDEAEINLHRIFFYCRDNPAAECAAERQTFIDSITYRPPAPTVESLRVIVRPQDYVDYLRQTDGGKQRRYPARRIGDDLFAFIAFDSARAIEVAPMDELADLGLTEEQAWERAQAQTRATIPDLPDGSALSANLHIYADQEYLPGILLPPADWEPIANAAGPDMVMSVISDDLVVVGVVTDGVDLDRLRQVSRENCTASPRCISENVYRWRNGRWVIAR